MRKRSWFTRSQLYFLLIVLNLSIIVLGAIFLSRYKNTKGQGVDEVFSRITVDTFHTSYPQYYDIQINQPESFDFDPNEADSTVLLRLGLAPFQVRSIYRYRAKGGRFSTKDDFKRVYRLTNEQWERLSPLISISKKYQLVDVPKQNHSASPSATKSYVQSESVDTPQNATRDSAYTLRTNYPPKLTGDETVDLNSGDSAMFCRVPGIGPYFSRQIVRLRKRLGGYVSTDQLLQIDNFPANSIAWFSVSDTVPIHRLNVNTMSIRKLMKHPYMGYYKASEIENYRRIYGRIKGADDLAKLKHFTPEDIERLKPYLEF